MDLDHPDIVQEELKHSGKKVAVPVFQDIAADDDIENVTEIDSLCMTCHEQGKTRLLLTRIPFFKEVIIGSFACEHCGFKNNEIQSAGRIQEKGVRITLLVTDKLDLNRQVIKSENATVKFPVVELEIPAKKGNLTTIEGLIQTTVEELSHGQPVRRIMEPERAAKIDLFVNKLNSLLNVEEPFEFVVDDPTGNSYVENPSAPTPDQHMRTLHYKRPAEMDRKLGIQPAGTETQPAVDSGTPKLSETPLPGEPGVEPVAFSDEVLSFGTNCTKCNAPCQTNMKVVDIPHFKQVVIMAMNCDGCGYKDNEVKSATGIEPKAQKMTLELSNMIDLSRDLMKSDTAGISIPELELELEPGTLGGKFTTIEGMLLNIIDQLQNTNFSFTGGDSALGIRQQKITDLCVKLEAIRTGENLNVHFILDDPAGNSYIQNIFEPAEDPQLTVEQYERTFEQNEELGLNDMKTENYSEESTQ